MYHITVLVPELQAACTVSVRLIHLERFSIDIPLGLYTVYLDALCG
jgi:hypothetical protein